jgi:2,5-diketo-D-gluconate reductase A
MGDMGYLDRLISEQTVELGSGARMPLLGLGTWQLRGRTAVDAVRHALGVGYRHIDTATMYGNESQVGQAIAESGVPRAQLFVTTKLRKATRDENGTLSARASLRSDSTMSICG